MTLGMIATVLGVAVAVGIIIKTNHDNAVAAEHREEQEERKAIAAAKKAKEQTVERQAREEAQEEREVEQELARIEAKFGRRSVAQLEKNITNSANEEAEEGFSETVSRTDCEPEGGKVDTTLTAQNFHCIAITSEEGGTENGYRYSGTINYVKGSLSWRLGGE